MLFEIIIFLALAALATLSGTSIRQAVLVLIILLPAYRLRLSLFGLPTNVFEMAVGVVFFIGLTQSPMRRVWSDFFQSIPWTLKVLIAMWLLAGLIACFTHLPTDTYDPALYHSLGILKSWMVIPLIFAFIIGSLIYQHREYINQVLTVLIYTGGTVGLIGLVQAPLLERVHSVYDVPNSLSLFLVPIVIMALWRGSPSHTIFSLIMLAAIIATQSISAAVAVVATLLIGSLLWRRKKMFFLSVLLTILSFIYFVQTGRIAYIFQSLIQPSSANSLSVRQQLWSISLDLIAQHPLTGVGLGRFEPAYQHQLHQRFIQYQMTGQGQAPIPEFVVRDPHNWVLSHWLNLGLIGVIAFIGIHVVTIKRACLGKSTPRLTQAILLSLLSLLVFGLTDTVYWKNDLAALQWFLLIQLLIYNQYHSLQTEKENRSPLSQTAG